MESCSAKAETVQQGLYLVYGNSLVLGRLVTVIAHCLRGKHTAEGTPHVDTGNFIVVINADKIRATGNNAESEQYLRHSGYLGGIAETTFRKMQAKFPGRVLEIALKGMLPKGPLEYAILRNLRRYSSVSHPHNAQQPKILSI
jgi:large subunit ribosomal protein L13